jgi:flagellar basal body-associated protein FliL
MVKLIGSGIWVVIVALVAVYFSVQSSLSPSVDRAVADRRASEETIRGELTSLPVMDKNGVDGYFLTKLSYVVDKVKMASIHIPIEVLVTDELFTTLIGEKMIDLSHRDQFDINKFRKQIKDALNKRLGDDVVHDVLVEQIDFLSKNEVRSHIAQGNLNIQSGAPIVKGDVVESGADHAAKKSAGH